MCYISVVLCISPSAALKHNTFSHYFGLNMVIGSVKCTKAASYGSLCVEKKKTLLEFKIHFALLSFTMHYNSIPC